MKTIAFFNSKSGVGKTTLVYHLAWMYAELGLNVVVADLDPQAKLTSLFVEEDRLAELWPYDGEHSQTILGTISPILEGYGDINEPYLEHITENISLIVGDLGLFMLEAQLSEAWVHCDDGNELALRILSVFHRTLKAAFQRQEADIVLIDLNSSLSAINSAALISAEYIITPLLPSPLFRYGLNNIEESLSRLREKWPKCLNKNSVIDLPTSLMQPVGYVIFQPRPPKYYTRWMDIPRIYHQTILNEKIEDPPDVTQDNYCLATLSYYWGLMQMAKEARKPIFYLKPADGAMGAHVLAVKDCYKDFKQLALKIANVCAIDFQNND